MPDSDDVAQYFTRSATTFDALYSQEKLPSLVRFLNRRFRRDIYERFTLTTNHIRKHNLKTILDVGCGPGRYAHALAQAGATRIVGLDVSEKMIELATARNSALNALGCSVAFVCSDFMEFRTNETFDTVLAMGFFDYVKDALPALNRMRPLATHSVIASFPSISWYRTPARKLRYYFKGCPVYFYKRSDIESLGVRAGFSSVAIRKIEGAGQDYFATFSE
jgi:2-polyprenyl-3-methyl-5-hydroxy-6-metoxy-1,4-benzoquinol methylase